MPRASVACRPGEAEWGWFVAPRGVTKPSHEVPLGDTPTASPTWEGEQPLPAARVCWEGGLLPKPAPAGAGAPRDHRPTQDLLWGWAPHPPGPQQTPGPHPPPHSPAWGASLPTQPWGLGGRQPTSRPDRGLDRAVGGPLPLAVAMGSGLGTRSAASHRSDGFRDSSV